MPSVLVATQEKVPRSSREGLLKMALDLHTRAQGSVCGGCVYQRRVSACSCRGHSLAAFVDDSHTGGVGDGLVILGPNELRALGHLGALKHHRDHAVIVHVHINLFGV